MRDASSLSVVLPAKEHAGDLRVYVYVYVCRCQGLWAF